MRIKRIHSVVMMGMLATSIAYCWNIDGTVSSSKGGVLQGVIVSVVDSSFKDTTDVQGKFALQNQSSVAIQNAKSTVSTNGINARLRGSTLEIQNSHSAQAKVSITDAQGNIRWSQNVKLGSGTQQIHIPEKSLVGVSFVRIQEEGNQFATMLQTGSRALALVAVTYPKLLFHKPGYQDTSYTMTSVTATGVSVIMRDTASLVVVTCPTQKLTAQDYNRSVSVNGVNRTYILHVPTAYNASKPAPLVVDFHYLTGSASLEESLSPYKAVTDPEGVITAYPDGVKGPGGNAWNVGPCCTTANDTAFARAMVADIEKVVCIEPKRVYAVGFSMGGGMTHYSACHLADIFAAVAPAAFDLLKENEGTCQPSRPITVISFRSTGDQTVYYDGRPSSSVPTMPITFLGAKGTFLKWSQLNQCTGSPSTEDPTTGCSTYSSCASGVQVTLCTTYGGGHDFGKAAIAWPLLKKYTLP